jgi:hypothetical protein
VNEGMKEWLKVKKIERIIKVRERKGRSKQLLYFFKITRIYRNMKAEALDRSPWNTLS